MRYDNIYCVLIEKCLSFHIMLYWLVCCVANHSLRKYFSSFGQRFAFFHTAIDAGRKFAWKKLKRTWKRVNVTQNGIILNRRRTLTSQDKMRSLYLKEMLLLSHGRELGMKSLTWTRKPYFTNYAADRSPQQIQTPLTSFTTYTKSCQTVRESLRMRATKVQLSAQNKP